MFMNVILCFTVIFYGFYFVIIFCYYRLGYYYYYYYITCILKLLIILKVFCHHCYVAYHTRYFLSFAINVSQLFPLTISSIYILFAFFKKNLFFFVHLKCFFISIKNVKFKICSYRYFFIKMQIAYV